MIIACEKCQLQYDVRAYAPGTRVRCRCSHILEVPEHIVATVRCPSCGGTVDASSERCQFCQSLISRRACPKCAAAVRENARFCDQCGETLKAFSVETAQASERNCPRCNVPLFHQTIAGNPVDACAECLGLWIPHEVLEQIYRDAPRDLPQTSKQVTVADPLADKARLGKNAATYIPCPACNKMMNPQNYARRSGVIIDICKEHGVWFDADELNKILEFHARGGVNQALDEEKQAARAAVHQLRMAQATAPGQQLGQDMRGGLSGGLGGGGARLLGRAISGLLFR